MKWLSQFSLIMRSSVTALREKVEDPERMLHQLILDMEAELDRVRGSVAEAIADEIQMQRRIERERLDVEKWNERAVTSLQRKDETSARTAIDQRVLAEERVARYVEEFAKQQKEVSKLRHAVQDLEDKIRQAKHKKTLLTARLVRAESARRIHTAMDRTTSESAFAQFSRLEEKVDRQESLGEAWEQLEGRCPEADEIARQFESDERRNRVDAELASLRAQVADVS
ncbi:MAG: PspA/IM30 family protein [Planctomyces sp.]|nr:PspA/IM30 family protein [Planctomyces sp.]